MRGSQEALSNRLWTLAVRGSGKINGVLSCLRSPRRISFGLSDQIVLYYIMLALPPVDTEAFAHALICGWTSLTSFMIVSIYVLAAGRHKDVSAQRHIHP